MVAYKVRLILNLLQITDRKMLVCLKHCFATTNQIIFNVRIFMTQYV